MVNPISAVGTLKSTGFASGNNTLAVAPAALGNLLVLATWITTSSGAPTVSAVSGGGCPASGSGLFGAWTRILASTQFTTPPATQRGDIWIGTATATGSSTITTTSSSGTWPGTNGLFSQEFTSGGGQGTVWAADGSGSTKTNATSTTITFPTLTPAGPNRIYLGPGYAGGTGSTSGGTAGYTVQLDANHNPFIYNTSVSTVQSPTSVQTSSTSDAMGILITATNPTARFMPFFM